MNDNEIIALQVDNNIYFGQKAIDEVLNADRCDRYYSRAVFQLMSMLDLEPQWKEWADTAPTLFLKSELLEYIKKSKDMKC